MPRADAQRICNASREHNVKKISAVYVFTLQIVAAWLAAVAMHSAAAQATCGQSARLPLVPLPPHQE